MRFLPVIAVIACSGSVERAPTTSVERSPSPPVAPPPVAPLPVPDAAGPSCTRVLAKEQLRPASANTQQLRWLDADTLGILIDNNGALGGPLDPEASGLVIYDLRRTYKPADLPLYSFRLGAEDFALRRGERLVMLVAPDGVATLDLDTGCLRHAKLPIARATAGDRPLLAAIDPIKGRFIAVSVEAVVRVDAGSLQVTTGLAQYEQAERRLAAIGYDPVTDLVFVRINGNKLVVLDATSLAERSSFAIPGAVFLQGGPYIRPGHAEAMVVYEVECKRRRRQPRHGMPVRPSCLDPVDQVRVARVDLTNGTVMESHPVRGRGSARGEPTHGWSGDGARFVLPTDGFVWEPPKQPVKVRPPRDFIYKFELDPTGTRFTDGGSHTAQVRELAGGKDTWTVFLPGNHVKQE